MERILIGDESDRYNHMRGDWYEESGSMSYASHEVLPFLNGRRWDRYALAWVHGLRPTKIRVVDGWEHCDSCLWRVTVYINVETRLIEKITQEIEIACLGDIENGHDLVLKTFPSP